MVRVLHSRTPAFILFYFILFYSHPNDKHVLPEYQSDDTVRIETDQKVY